MKARPLDELATTQAVPPAVRERILLAAYLMNSERFLAWADLFTPSGEYSIHVQSPELNGEQIWQIASRRDLIHNAETLSQHVRDDYRHTHVVSPLVALESSTERTQTVSSFSVFRTSLRGETSVFAVGHYDDVWVNLDQTWKLERRRVRLDTRELGTGSHLPI